jgi:beta-lactamase class A
MPQLTTLAAATASGSIAVDPAFQSYYSRHGGADQLGQPITPAFPTADGLLQVFSTTALMLPSAGAVAAEADATSSDPLIGMLRDGVHDRRSTVVELALLHNLLSAGSEDVIGGAGSTLTYVSLRSATYPTKRLTESPVKDLPDSVFVSEQADQGKYSGHRVPIGLWNYMNQPTVAPDGWEQDFGQPLTEALPLTLTDANGTVHHELVQAFWQTTFIVDADTLDAPDGPTIHRAAIGQDYLTTFGFPAVKMTPGASAWVSAWTSPRGAPTTTGAVLSTLGPAWPITLSGSTSWVSGALWYQVTWHTAKHTGSGWIPAAEVTETQPASGSVPMANMDTLSPDLTAYLANLSGTAGVAIYDVSRNQWYSYDGDEAYTMGSSAKVPIMLTYLAAAQQQGRSLSDDEIWLLTTMIENSNNDSAQALFDSMGGDPAIINFLQSIGLSGYSPNSNGWGWATFTPDTMVHLLTLLYQKKILSDDYTGTALSLMQNVQSDQRFGLGDTSPSGATVYMKDGWVVGPDGSWDANSSGIVTIGHETYILSVYTTGQTDLDTNYGILQHVCGTVGALLT